MSGNDLFELSAHLISKVGEPGYPSPADCIRLYVRIFSVGLNANGRGRNLIGAFIDSISSRGDIALAAADAWESRDAEKIESACNSALQEGLKAVPPWKCVLYLAAILSSDPRPEKSRAAVALANEALCCITLTGRPVACALIRAALPTIPEPEAKP